MLGGGGGIAVQIVLIASMAHPYHNKTTSLLPSIHIQSIRSLEHLYVSFLFIVWHSQVTTLLALFLQFSFLGNSYYYLDFISVEFCFLPKTTRRQRASISIPYTDLARLYLGGVCPYDKACECVNIKPQSADFFQYKPWRPKGFLQFETIINVLVISFWFIWLPMLWVYDH